MSDLETLLADIIPHIENLETRMSSPEVLGDQHKMKEFAREHNRLVHLRDMRKKLIMVKDDIEELEEALEDPELAELAEIELEEKREELDSIETKIKRGLIPEAPEDARSSVLEIRAGTGGEEAALFAMDLHKMYIRFCEKNGWKFKVLNAHYTELGGIKELVMSISGDGVYGKLKFESGVHRVQRVPQTETQGRVHTSAATVAVLPEAEEVDVQIDPKDLKIDTFRSSGPGGQHVNKTDSAIRLTHLPSGLVVSCQDEKSQYKNKVQAMRVLRSRLYQQAIEEEENKRAAERKSKVSSGDRSAKIKTYNFPQGRITDHRVPVTLYRLEEVLAGDMDMIIDPLLDYLSEKKLAEVMKEMENE